MRAKISLELLVFSVLAGLLLASFVGLAVLISIGDPPLQPVSEGSDIVYREDENNYLRYTRTVPTSISGHQIGFTLQKGDLDAFGATASLAYVSNEEYQEMIRDYTSIGACPSGYINERLKLAYLFAADPQVAERLRSSPVKRSGGFRINGTELQLLGGKFSHFLFGTGDFGGQSGIDRFILVDQFEMD